ncbi:MAG: glycosyltransferase family 2 protein [Paludibacteraceae bacterium]|nr:glycosyltransferase family 2 protein [Paludibacteraceae bacterium]MBR1481293.1 glycosyltransferase family 2 protein [Paludibacteraceae bacterium]
MEPDITNNRLVSIITPVYNGERFMSQTIDSVLRQTYPHWEMLIINDGSRDNSLAIAQDYAARDPRIRVIDQPNAGSAAARNNGIRQAQGRYIALLDADDLWEPAFLESQLRFMADNNARLVCSAHKRIDEQGREILRPYTPPFRATYRDMLRTCSITCLTGLYDTVPYGKFYLREDFRSLRDDYLFWLEIMRRAGDVYGNPEVLGSYRMSTSGVSHSKRRMIRPQYLAYRRGLGMGVLPSLYYLCCWAWAGFMKYRK